MTKLFKNVRLVDGGSVTEGDLLVNDGKVAGLLPKNSGFPVDEVIDGEGLYASAGFVETHSHGAGGADFMDGTPEAYKTACRVHLLHGTTTMYPTTLAASREELEQSIRAFGEVKDELNKTQCVPGLHLEGPYFSMEQKGGQDPRSIRNPDPEEYKALIELADGNIKRWTVAPELPGALEMGDYMAAHGILGSIGHTSATYDDCVKALDHGYSHVTHLYSATSTITRKSGFRILGVTESAYCLDGLTVEIIADGCHLPPELIAMIVKCKGVENISLISDSLKPTGLDVKEFSLGGKGDSRPAIIEDGVAKLPDRTAFAGSIATGDRLVKTVWKKAGIPLPDVIRMASENPAKRMGLADKGRLLPGYDADIVLFDEDVNVKGVFFKGNKIA